MVGVREGKVEGLVGGRGGEGGVDTLPCVLRVASGVPHPSPRPKASMGSHRSTRQHVTGKRRRGRTEGVRKSEGARRPGERGAAGDGVCLSGGHCATSGNADGDRPSIWVGSALLGAQAEPTVAKTKVHAFTPASAGHQWRLHISHTSAYE